MKNGTKIYQKIKKIKKVKTSLSKHKILNRSNNTKLENLIKTKEYEEDYPVSFIKSKSLKKLKIYNGFNNKKDNTIKLPSLQKHLHTNANDSKMKSNFLNRNNTIKKIKLNTNNIHNINNLYSKNKSSKKLLSKHSGSTYNYK